MQIKRWYASKTLFAALMAITAPLPAQALEIGDQAASFELPGLENTVKLANAQGKYVYLDFWASWCGPCRQSFPWMNEMNKKYSAQGVEIIAVNLDSKREDAAKFLSETPANFTIAFDSNGATPKQYGVRGMPTSLLIGKDGKILYKHVGFNDHGREEVENMIKVALGEKK